MQQNVFSPVNFKTKKQLRDIFGATVFTLSANWLFT